MEPIMIQIFWKLVTKQTSYFLVQVCKGQKQIPQKNFSILLSGTKITCLSNGTHGSCCGWATQAISRLLPSNPGNYSWRHLIRTVVETFWQNQTFILYIHPDIYSDIHPDYIRTFILNILWNAVWQCSLTFILTCIFHISKQWSWHKFWHLIWEVFCIRYSDMYAFSHLFWHVQISATPWI